MTAAEVDDLPGFALDLENDRMRRTVGVLVQTDVRGEALGEHRERAAGEVGSERALVRPFVERRLGRDPRGDVGDMDADLDKRAVAAGADGQRVVEVLGVDRVDRDREAFAEVLPGDVARHDRGGGLFLCFGVRRFEAVFGADRVEVALDRTGLTDGFCHGGGVAVVIAQEVELDPFAASGPLETARDREFFGETPVERADDASGEDFADEFLASGLKDFADFADRAAPVFAGRDGDFHAVAVERAVQELRRDEDVRGFAGLVVRLDETVPGVGDFQESGDFRTIVAADRRLTAAVRRRETAFRHRFASFEFVPM